MSPIEVCILAVGSLGVDDARDLADLGIREDVGKIVLEGTVVDQAALVGALERLRRAGLRIRQVSRGPGVLAHDAVATLVVDGQAGALLQAVLKEAVVRQQVTTTTTADVTLREDDDVFAVLTSLGAFGLELRSLHVRTIARPSGGGK